MQYSKYQTAIFDFVQNNTGSAIVDAKAGAGKTSTCLAACSKIPSDKSVLFLAFNRDIVEELKSKLPKGIKCVTFNACGWGAWRSYTGKKYLKVDGKKSWKIIWDNFAKEDQREYGAFVAKVVDLAKCYGLKPGDSNEDWYDIVEHHNVSLSSTEATYSRGIELAKKVLQASIDSAYTICDFNDQLYMPWLMNANFEKFDVIFIDEAQDTNKIQLELLRRMLAKNGRLFAVGDPQQCIYGFRGSDHNAMNNIKDVFNCETLPLSISYRCAKNVILEAQKYVPDIEYFEKSSDGEVTFVEKYDIGTFKESDAILCRNNSPLVEIAYQFIARGKAVNFLGRDIGGGLKSLIKNMSAKNLDDLSDKLDAWFIKESEKLIKKRQEDKVQLLEDRVNCIETFIKYLPHNNRSIDGLLNAIDSLFKGNSRGITLSSAHKSKGKEWDRVFILGFDKYMPSQYAKKSWQKVQENNLIYVAITRAKKSLVYIDENCWTDEPNIELPKGDSSVTKSNQTKERKPQVKSDGILYGFNPFKK